MLRQMQSVDSLPVFEKVPKWVRLYEELRLLSPRAAKLGLTALGGSVSTPYAGIVANVLVVASFNELTQKCSQVGFLFFSHDQVCRIYLTLQYK